MRLRSAALAGFALFLLGTPARTDEVVFAAASSDENIGADDAGFYLPGSGVATMDASAILSGSSFSLPSAGDGYFSSGAGTVPFFSGGVTLEDMQSVTVVTTDDFSPIAIDLWFDSGAFASSPVTGPHRSDFDGRRSR
jgi:hypothetical protein